MEATAVHTTKRISVRQRQGLDQPHGAHGERCRQEGGGSTEAVLTEWRAIICHAAELRFDADRHRMERILRTQRGAGPELQETGKPKI